MDILKINNKDQERRPCCSGVFIARFEHISLFLLSKRKQQFENVVTYDERKCHGGYGMSLIDQIRCHLKIMS